MMVATRTKRRWAVLANAAVLLIGTGGLSAGANDAGGAMAPPTADVHGSFPGARLLALADNQLLIWDVHGRALLRRGDGTWTEEFRLPVEGILDAEADGSGYLIAGVVPQGGPAIVAMTTSGKEVGRWKLAGDGAFAVSSDPSGRRAATRGGSVALNSDGTLGEVHPYPEDDRLRHGDRPTILQHGGATVVCYPADWSMAHHARGSCERLGDSGWRFKGDFTEPPLPCGAWIITKSGAPAKSGARTTELAAWSFERGKLAGRSRHVVRPAIACAQPDMLLVGDRRLHLVRLPNLEAAWTGPVDTAASPIHDVAVTDGFFAYRRDESLDVVVLPRPRIPPRAPRRYRPRAP